MSTPATRELNLDSPCCAAPALGTRGIGRSLDAACSRSASAAVILHRSNLGRGQLDRRGSDIVFQV
jgi:hypothetical protein